MANTEHEHAGNTDLLRRLQHNTSARCELCHYADGAETASVIVTLEPVKLPSDRVALFCQLCISLCKQVGDDDFTNASKMIRPLPQENAEANETLLKDILAEAAKADTEDLTNY